MTADPNKLSDMAFALARARQFVANDIEYPLPGTSAGHVDSCREILAAIDNALKGTIHERGQKEIAP